MNRVIALVSASCAFVVSSALAADPVTTAAIQTKSGVLSAPSKLFDKLGKEPDVVYLIANSSLVFGPDPHGRSEEITFIGPVTVPKWPMEGYGRRVLPDGRQQIDIELTQSELTGESYVLHGPIVLGENPDLRSLGTITERPPKTYADASSTNDSEGKEKPTSATNAENTPSQAGNAPSEEAPADFVVERKVLMTTAKGILYNETAVPVRGRIDAIPPIKFQNTPTGVNVFRGMELPTPLLDKEGNVNGWFYSKSHMAFAVLPKAVERSFIKGTVEFRSGDQTETVEVGGPAEIHHLAGSPEKTKKTDVEVMMLALRGTEQVAGRRYNVHADVQRSRSFLPRSTRMDRQRPGSSQCSFGPLRRSHHPVGEDDHT